MYVIRWLHGKYAACITSFLLLLYLFFRARFFSHDSSHLQSVKQAGKRVPLHESILYDTLGLKEQRLEGAAILDVDGKQTSLE